MPSSCLQVAASPLHRNWELQCEVCPKLLNCCCASVQSYAVQCVIQIYTAQQTAYETFRHSYAFDNVLTYYDPLQEIGVSADAYSEGLIAVVFHTDALGMKRCV